MKTGMDDPFENALYWMNVLPLGLVLIVCGWCEDASDAVSIMWKKRPDVSHILNLFL